MEKYRDLGILILYCGLIFFVSSLPKVPLPDEIPNQDKFLHFAAYGVMAALAWRCFRHHVEEIGRLTIFCVGFCLLYGLSDELHQYFVPGRNSSLYDVAADLFGAIFSVYLIRVFKPALVLG